VNAISAGTTNATPVGIASVELQLQTLNNTLAALGLDETDIERVDQIASLINDFNPAAFTSLAYQLEALAQNAAQQSAAVSVNATGQAPTAGANSTAEASANTFHAPAAVA